MHSSLTIDGARLAWAESDRYESDFAHLVCGKIVIGFHVVKSNAHPIPDGGAGIMKVR